ncbi:PEP-CTERM sorting domain-containing protein [Pyxidicoccus trucidator]|uniref:PEP-CTERM sorting domain-containing protein n=1 Tax=Pyxidicoccus trucidator TaxID=2709662 RepID=UPI00196894C2|nr:PEP-CTERM sorting domain-containing protein [Pyxidicoccus trucidator]
MLHALFGVVLPAVTLGVELVTGMCADTFFDPLPTPLHILLVAAVPAANALALVVIHRRASHLLRAQLLLNGAALGVGLLYTLLFLPLLPLALIGIFFGIGVLPLAPLSSLLSGVLLRRRLLRSGWPLPATRWWPGALVAVLLIIAGELPGAVTRVGLHVAATGSPSAQAQALRVLRVLGSEEALREACYEGSRRYSLLGFLLAQDEPVLPDDARRVFYRVTGRPFNAESRPEGRRGHLVRGWDSWDRDTASEQVGGRVPGLSLSASTMEGSVDADAALGYLEWTMEFATTEPGQHEARMLVQLPPGGVVSRVTLYIDGEPREAAFAGTGKVRAAYTQVVQRRMDPLLVTARPGDRVQVQAFPILKGKPMRVKLGISAPLVLEDAGRAGALPLPTIQERNFDLAETFRHAARIESRQPMTGLAAAPALARGDGVHEWLGALSDAQVRAHEATLRVKRTGAPVMVWSPDLPQPDAFTIRQRVEEVLSPKPAKLLIVVDGSEGMEPALEALADALATVPDGVELAVFAARDGVEELVSLRRAEAGGRGIAAERLRELSATGGQDTAPALARAWPLLATDASSIVLWVHGAQPLPPDQDVAELRLSGPRAVEVVDVQTASGPNAAAEALPAHVPLRPLPRTATLRQDLERLFSAWGTPRPTFVRERVAASASASAGQRTSAHLARLWARDEVARMLASGREDTRDEAQTLAVAHQLVTGVTGAVVLERKEQYDAAGLTPVDPGTVPTVPEPETWLLLAMACVLLGVVALRRRRMA